MEYVARTRALSSDEATNQQPRKRSQPTRASSVLRVGRPALMLAVVLLTACASEPTSTGVTPAVVAPADDLPDLDPELVGQGERLYTALCASCHGVDLAGESDWKVPNPDGSFKPPPQDSTGHTWHHSDRLLVDLILNGSTFDRSRMPTFRDVLSESETLAILEYLKSSWGEQEREFQFKVSSQDG